MESVPIAEITGKILEDKLENIRTQGANKTQIDEYMEQYIKYYSYNPYKDKNNEGINPTIFSNYKTPKEYEINFDSQEIKVNINLYEKYIAIFTNYYSLDSKLKEWEVEVESESKCKAVCLQINNLIRSNNILEEHINLLSGGGAQSNSDLECVNPVNSDIIYDPVLKHINLLNGKMVKLNPNQEKDEEDEKGNEEDEKEEEEEEEEKEEKEEEEYEETEQDIIYRKKKYYNKPRCQINYQNPPTKSKWVEKNIPFEESESIDVEKTTISNLLPTIYSKSLITIIKFLILLNRSTFMISIKTSRNLNVGGQTLTFDELGNMIIDYSYKITNYLMIKKNLTYPIYKYCLPIIYKLTFQEKLNELFEEADRLNSDTKCSYYTEKIIQNKFSNSSEKFYSLKNEKSIDLDNMFKKESRSLYKKFYHDINKISICSKELVEDIELIKNVWFSLDHRICLGQTIVYYYSYIYLKYYTGTLGSTTGSGAGAGASSTTNLNPFGPIQITGSNLSFKDFADFVIKKKIFRKPESMEPDEQILKISSDRRNFDIRLDTYYDNKELPDNLEPIANLFLDPLSLCLINFNIRKEDPFILLNWIKIMIMNLNDCYDPNIIPFNEFKIELYNRKSDKKKQITELLSYKTLDSDKQINIFHRYYIKTKGEISESNILNKMLEFVYTDYANNSSNFYGMCIDSDYNNIDSFFSLMKSKSYENIFNIFPFVKYGFISSSKLKINNTIIKYIDYEPESDSDSSDSSDSSDYPDPIIKYQIGSYDIKNNPNCLSDNLITFVNSTINYSQILSEYIDGIKTIEKKNAQTIFYNLYTISKLYSTPENGLDLDLRLLFEKMSFPANLYTIQEINDSGTDYYFKIICIFNNLIYIQTQDASDTDTKAKFSELIKMFISIYSQVKVIISNPESTMFYKSGIQSNKINIDTFKYRFTEYKKEFEKKTEYLDTSFPTYRTNCLTNNYDNASLFERTTSNITKSITFNFTYFYKFLMDNDDFNIRYNFFDVIYNQLFQIISPSYYLINPTFKDTIFNDNLYIEFKNQEGYNIERAYRFYKNIYDNTNIKPHVLVFKNQFATNEPSNIEIDNLIYQKINNIYDKGETRPNFVIKLLIGIKFLDKTYTSRYKWESVPEFLVFDTAETIRTKSGKIDFPMFMESAKFILKYNWDSDFKTQYNYTLDPEQKLGLKTILTTGTIYGKKRFTEFFIEHETNETTDNELVSKILDYVRNIQTESDRTQINTKIRDFIHGSVIETKTGTNKNSREIIKLINTRQILNYVEVKDSPESSNYKIYLEEKSNVYEYIKINDILVEGNPTILQTLILKFLNFTEFDTIDVWANISNNDYLIKLNSFDIQFEIKEDLNIYMGNTNNLVLKDGNSNWMINKWVAYTNNLFISKNLTSGKYYLNIFDINIGLKTIPINKNIFYPQFDSCNVKVLKALKKSYFNYDTKENPDSNYQNILDLIVVMSKFGAMCKDVYPIKSIRFKKYNYPINNIKLKYNLVGFPELTLTLVSENDPDFSRIIDSNIANIDAIKQFVNQEITKINSEYIYNPESEYSHNLPTFLLTRLYKNNEVSNKYFSFMFGVLSLGYFDLLKSRDYDNFNFYIEIYNQIKLHGLISNPSELFYQFVYGFLAKPEQLELVDAVTEDLCGTFEYMDGGFRYDNVQIRNSRQLVQSNGGRIHNLIMGGGKTSMVTPLAVLRTFHIINQGKKSDEAIYLILPSQLVIQSSMALSQYLTNFFPVLVTVLDESRSSTNNNTWNASISNIKCNIKHNNLYILSDTTLKCGFINDYENGQDGIKFNANRNKYIIDEVDTILNPLVSELNYPVDKKSNESKLKSIDNYFEPIFNTLNTLYKEPNEELTRLISSNPNGFSTTPHFNLLDSNLLPDVLTTIRNILIDNYRLKNNDLYVEFLSGTIEQDRLFGLGDSDLQSFYILNNFLFECVPTFLTIINRKNYGLHDGLTVIPFAYADTPSVGSEFSNPLIIMCLTIIDYLVQIVKLNDKIIGQMIEIIKREYLEIPEEIRTKSVIAEIYGSQSVSLSSLNISNATESIKKLFRTNVYFIKICLKIICYESIRIFADQLNITGVDLVMYSNINFKTGFTGTPNIAKFYDLEPEKQMQIEPIKPVLVSTINNAILQASIISIDGSDRAEYLNNIYSNTTVQSSIDNIRVLIDAGGVFAGIKPINVFQMIIQVNPSVTNMFYWNDDNIPKKITKSSNSQIKISDWNLDYEPDSFYYYDHKHTTGTDAKIPIGSVGLALIGKDDRYRDVAQAIFRMRKLTKGHNIIFVLNNKVTNKITSNGLIPINTELLLEWFQANETNILEQHQKVMKLYNLRAIFKILGRTSKAKSFANKYIKSRLENTYKILNKFYYPTKKIFDTQELLYNYLMYNTDTNSIDINKLVPVFESNPVSNSLFAKLSTDMGSNTLAISQNLQLNININININISQNISQIQKIPDNPEPDNIIDIGKLYRYINDKLPEKDNLYERTIQITNPENLVSNYYYYEPRNPEQNQFVAKNMYWYLLDKTQLKGFWLYNIATNKFFLIPLFEGIKLIDYINNIRTNGLESDQENFEQFNNVDIYDNFGNIHLVSTIEKTPNYIYESNGIGSYIKIITKLYDPNVKIYLRDFYNLLFVSKDKLVGLIEKYVSVDVESDLIKSELSTSFNFYINQIVKLYVQTPDPIINQVKRSIDQFNSQAWSRGPIDCTMIVNELKTGLMQEASELFEKIINFFTFDKKICYQLDNEKIEQVGGLHKYYYSKYIK